MASGNHTAKPKFGSAELWGACSRCNARVRYSTLRRERLTGLLVCTKASGRGTSACFDPWPVSYDFQVYPDKSIEPPAEPLPLRYNLDNIWGNGPASGAPSTFAAAPTPAPDDATRLAALLRSVPSYLLMGKTASFPNATPPVNSAVANLGTFLPADYDGTFIPSTSVRTVTPPSAAAELAAVNTDSTTGDEIWTPPWAAQQGI